MSKVDELKLNARELQLKMLFDEQEKRIEELEQTNNNLLDVINNQDVKIVDLEKQIVEYKNGNFVQTVNQIIKGKDKQIEEMKCCGNCKNQLSLAYGELSCDLYGECKHYSKWELRR